MREYFKAKLRNKSPKKQMLQEKTGNLRHQWFWIGNQEQTEILTPDIKHTVKRHIVLTRVIPDGDFPIRVGQEDDTGTVQEVVDETRGLRNLLPLKERSRTAAEPQKKAPQNGSQRTSSTSGSACK
jgi:hypothetical protein